MLTLGGEIFIVEDFLERGYGMIGYRVKKKSLCAFTRIAFHERNPLTRRKSVIWEEFLDEIDRGDGQ